jgi:hypothetical protein
MEGVGEEPNHTTTRKPGHPSIVQYSSWEPEVEFLDVVGTKVLRIFLLANHRHLLPPPPPPAKDYAKEHQRNCTFINSDSAHSELKVFGWHQIAVPVDSSLWRKYLICCLVCTLLKCSYSSHIQYTYVHIPSSLQIKTLIQTRKSKIYYISKKKL